MAELTIDPASIRKALDDFVASYKPSDTPTQEVGYVATAGDGIAHVTGLPGCMANELLTFEDGTLGLAFNLDAREIGVVILGDFAGIEEGQEVRRTGEVLSVPVGDGYLGRVVDPLGNPIDGLGEIQGIEGRRILEAQAPDVMHRHPVDEPLSTGLKAIDAMTPVGRGQRQLIIGDRQTGKTAIAIDTIINQKANWESGDPKKQVRCIYVAIGQKGSTIASVKQSLEDAGAMEYTTIVASPAADSAGFKYIAPYTGSAIAYKTDKWNISRLDNSFQLSGVMMLDSTVDNESEAERIVRLAEQKFAGNPGQVMFVIRDGGEGDNSRFIPIASQNEGDWQALHEQAVSDIVVAHSWFRTLSGLDYASGFSAERILHEYEVALNTVILGEKAELTEPVREAITSILGIDASSLQVINRPPTRSKPIYMKVWEARKADGLDYDPDDERQQAFLSEITKYNIRSIE